MMTAAKRRRLLQRIRDWEPRPGFGELNPQATVERSRRTLVAMVLTGRFRGPEEPPAVDRDILADGLTEWKTFR